MNHCGVQQKAYKISCIKLVHVKNWFWKWNWIQYPLKNYRTYIFHAYKNLHSLIHFVLEGKKIGSVNGGALDIRIWWFELTQSSLKYYDFFYLYKTYKSSWFLFFSGDLRSLMFMILLLLNFIKQFWVQL